jgi:peptide/nickel transport system ATP-binding protein
MESVAEAYLMNFSGLQKQQRWELAATLLGELWLEGDLISRLPQSLSGGERKRASLARALAALGWGLTWRAPELRPSGLLFLDEPLSSLDPVVQGQSLKTLLAAQKDLDLSLFVITHDLAMARALADRVLVMYGGEIVEVLGEKGEEFRHPFSLQLLSSWDKVPEPLQDGACGCVFISCCHHKERSARCDKQEPLLGNFKSQVACWAV